MMVFPVEFGVINDISGDVNVENGVATAKDFLSVFSAESG